MTDFVSIPVFDGHNDSLLMTYTPELPQRSLLVRSDAGHIDLPRAESGGMFGGLFAISVAHPDQQFPDPEDTGKTDEDTSWILVDPVSPNHAKAVTDRGIREFKSIIAASGGRMAMATTVEEILDARERGVLSAVLHFEGAEAIDENLDNLNDYYRQGLRSVGLVWSRENVFGHGVTFGFPGSPDTGPGLTDAGRRLVRQCNQLGIMLDLAHLNEKGFWDVERISSAPLVATHSCVHVLCPSPRNLTDKQLDAIAASNGVVGINFCVAFLREDGKNNTDTPLETMVAHFRYIADRIGVAHVAFGSDFDGASIPKVIGDVAGMPKLIDALQSDGFSRADLEKIAWGNWMRVLGQTLKS